MFPLSFLFLSLSQFCRVLVFVLVAGSFLYHWQMQVFIKCAKLCLMGFEPLTLWFNSQSGIERSKPCHTASLRLYIIIIIIIKHLYIIIINNNPFIYLRFKKIITENLQKSLICRQWIDLFLFCSFLFLWIFFLEWLILIFFTMIFSIKLIKNQKCYKRFIYAFVCFFILLYHDFYRTFKTFLDIYFNIGYVH